MSKVGKAALLTLSPLGAGAMIPAAYATMNWWQSEEQEENKDSSLVQVSAENEQTQSAPVYSFLKTVKEFPKKLTLWGLTSDSMKTGVSGTHTKNLNCCDDKDLDNPRKGVETKEVSDFKFGDPKNDSHFLFLQFPDNFNNMENYLTGYGDEWVSLNWNSSFATWDIKFRAEKTKDNGSVNVGFQFPSGSGTSSSSLTLPQNNSKVFLLKLPKNKIGQLLDE